MIAPRPSAWAHEIATSIINKQLDWKRDRTALLRDMTLELEKAYAAGIDCGTQTERKNQTSHLFNDLVLMCRASPEYKNHLQELCARYIANETECNVRIE